MKKIYDLFWKYFWLFGLIPIYLYIKNIAFYATNLPHWDDYAIISFLQKYSNSTGFAEKFHLLFAQHNEHRIVFTRLIALLIFNLKGNLDFVWMIWIGNTALIGILFLFYKFLKRNALSINYLVPICFLLLQLTLYENSLWGMASVQNFWVILFVLMAIWQLADDKIPYFATFLATFTSGNGLVLLIIIGVVILLLKRKFYRLLVFIIYTSILFILYYAYYTKPPDTVALSLNIAKNIKGLFLILGSFSDFNIYLNFIKRIGVAQVSGFVIIIIFGLSLIYKYLKTIELGTKKNFNLYFIFGVFLFITGTAFATTISRLQYGEYVLLTSKYRLYSILLLAITYFILLLNFRYLAARLILLCGLFAYIFIYLNTCYYFLGDLKKYHNKEVSSYYNAWHKGNESIENKSKPYYSYQKNVLDGPIFEDTTLKYSPLGKVIQQNNIISVSNNNFNGKVIDVNDGPYLEFINDKQHYFFAAQQEVPNNKKAYLLGKANYFSMGFQADISLIDLPTDNYFVNIIKCENGFLTRIPCNYYIEIEGKREKEVRKNW